MNEKKHEKLEKIIKEKALAWALGRAEVEEIDAIKILQASLLAMQRAVEALAIKPEHVLVDGNRLPVLTCSGEAIINGDLSVPAISAASIIAKVARDDEMRRMYEVFPGYGLAKHKGYPTKAHINALAELGVTTQHRRSFGPVKKLI